MDLLFFIFYIFHTFFCQEAISELTRKIFQNKMKHFSPASYFIKAKPLDEAQAFT